MTAGEAAGLAAAPRGDVSASASVPAIELAGVGRLFRMGAVEVRALDAVDLAIQPGEFVAIMGQSGSGKSTLMNIIGGLDRATSGHYRLFGRDVAALDGDGLARMRRECFGFIFQRYNLIGAVTALGNVEIPAIYAGLPPAARHARATALLARLGMADRLDHAPGELSGGQQQRVAIARALINDPPVILADEPTGALDSRSGAEVLALLRDLHREGRTILLITHDEAVAAHADRVVRLADGRLAEAPPLPRPTAHGVAPVERPGIALGDSLREAVAMALQALRINLFRTGLTLLGIIIGVAAVIAMLAVGSGSKQQVVDSINAMGSDLLTVRPGAPGIRFAGDIATLTPEDALAIAGVAGVTQVLPERRAAQTVRFGARDMQTTIQGTGADLPAVRAWPLARGSFFDARDVAGRAPVAVLGQTVADALFPGEADPVGQYVMVRNVLFEVIGVMAEKGASPMGSDQDDAVFMPYTTVMSRVAGKKFLSAITVKVDAAADIDAVQERIEALLHDRHGIEDYQIRNMASFMETASEAQDALTLLLGTVAAISLLVGGIGVMNIMLVSVTERTREIGIRMATGARERDILLQFNIESAVVCAVGGIIGLVLGFAIAWLLGLFGMPIRFTAGPPLMALASAVATGLAFGYLPARKAARLDPVVALASE